MKTSEGKRLHPLSSVLLALRALKDFLLPLLIIFVSQFFRGQSATGEYSYRILFGAVFLVLAIVSGIWSWAVFRYGTKDGKLFVYQGVFFKKRQYIPYERIQSIDLTEGLLHRLFGLVRVQVQTAGGQKPEAVLTAVTKEAAADLQLELRGRKRAEAVRNTQELGDEREREDADSGPEERVDSPAEVLEPAKDNVIMPKPSRRLPFGQLFIAGLTSGSLGVAFSLIFAAFTQLDEWFPNLFLYSNVARWGWRMLILAVLCILLLAVLVAILSAMIRFANFTVTRDGDELLIERGLLEIKRVTLPIRRIQAIVIVEEPVWQPFGLASIQVESVGYGNEKGESTLLFPLLRKDEIRDFLKEFAPVFVQEEDKAYTPVSRKALPGYLFPVPAVLAVLTLIIGYFTKWGAIGWGLVVLFLLLGWWKYKTAGWIVDADKVIFRYRRISRMTAIIPRGRIQSYSVGRHPFQLRKGLCTAKATVASGGGGTEFRIKGMPAEEGLAILAWYRRWNVGPGRSADNRGG